MGPRCDAVGDSAVSHLFRTLAGAVVASVVLSITAVPSVAKPPTRPNAPTDLAVSPTKSGSTFAVQVSWAAATNATKYAVQLSSGGATLESGTVSTLSWTGHTTLSDGTTVKVSVTAYNGRRRGGTATKSLVLPDLTPPTASYVVTHAPAPTAPNVTVAVSSLADNLTSAAELSQVIDWGEGAGSAAQPWPSTQGTISHSYPDVEGRYEAKVMLRDKAGNEGIYPLVIVVRDETGPTGQFILETTSAWAGWTKVRLAQADIHDDLSPDDKITRVINWGDGAQTIWTQGTTPAHVYGASGSYSPTVTLTDEAGNASAPLATSTVVVDTDLARPTVRLTPPTRRTAHVASWRTLKGRAADAQTGVRNVKLKAIEKRRTGWRAYQATTCSWVKATSRSAAWKRTVAASVRPTQGSWSVRLCNLRKGRLLYKARAFDNRANASFWVSKKARLTKR